MKASEIIICGGGIVYMYNEQEVRRLVARGESPVVIAAQVGCEISDVLDWKSRNACVSGELVKAWKFGTKREASIEGIPEERKDEVLYMRKSLGMRVVDIAKKTGLDILQVSCIIRNGVE